MNQPIPQADSGSESRRAFIKKTASAAAAVASVNLFKTPVYGQTQAPSTGRVIGANDRINVAFIGVGVQGTAHLNSIKGDAGENNVAIVAVCDVSKTRVAAAQQVVPDCKGYGDYKKMLEDKGIDAVVVSSVDHWHAQHSMDAMETGKHVYCEKPMTRYLDEAFKVYDVVKKTGRCFQVGSQICSDARWHKAAEMIQAGKIGPLVMGQDSYMRNNYKGEWNYAIKDWATPADVDWKSWLNANIKKKTDFNADTYLRWRKYYPYCSGLLGDLMPHRLHPFMMASGNPEFPARVSAIGTRKVLTDKNTPDTPIRDVPEHINLIAEFPSGYTLVMSCSTVNEQGLASMIRGHKGSIYFGAERVELKPERPFSEEIDAELLEGLKPAGERIPEMEKNWFQCIRSGKPPYANIDLAIRVQTVISLAEMSDRMSTMCVFDEKTRKITANGKEVPAITYGTLELS